MLNKNIFKIIIFVCLIFFLLFFSYPVKKIEITSTFGETRGDHFHDGIDFSGNNQPVFPIGKGKIIFYRDNRTNPFSHHIGLGNYIFIKTYGYSAFYCHLQNNIPIENYSVNTNTVIGYSGNTGHSTGAHLHLSIMDENLNYINPYKLLPNINDNTQPIIKRVYINNRRLNTIKKIDISVNQNLTVSAQDYYGNSSYRIPQGVYKIQYILNDLDKKSISCDTLKKENGEYKLNGSYSFSDIFDKSWHYNLGRINSIAGINRLKIIVYDFSGNRTTKVYTYTGYEPAK